VLRKLEAVSPLLAGLTEATDNDLRQAVPQEQIDAVKKLVSERCRDLIELQLCTGARPAELMKLNSRMIDRSGEIWCNQFACARLLH
jgi:integrase